MKLLVDNQLPAALARYLTDNGFDCRHVQDIGMDASDDREIWELAKSERMVIVTKDEDFALMADRQAGHYERPHRSAHVWHVQHDRRGKTRFHGHCARGFGGPRIDRCGPA